MWPFLIEGVQKLTEVFKNLGLDTFPDPSAILGPLAAILDFAGGAALQAVSERPLRR